MSVRCRLKKRTWETNTDGLLCCINYVKLGQIIACLELKYLLKKTGLEASRIKILLKLLTINEM